MRFGAHLIVLIGMLLASCSVDTLTQPDDPAARATGISSSTSLPAEPTTTATVEVADPLGRVGLYQVDPRTLEPVDASAPITTGDWFVGRTSSSGDWLALTVWLESGPDSETDLIRVVNVGEQRVVSEARVLIPTYPLIADDGTAYWIGNPTSFGRLYSLEVGAESAELAFDEFPAGFEAMTAGTILDNHRIGWLGLLYPQTEGAAGLVVLDLATSTTATYPLSEVTVGGDEFDVGETRIYEWFQPEVIWDAERDLAYVVHADRDAFTVVDLETGATSAHSWAPPTSWFGRLLAWWIPPAQAKGPSLGTRRSLALSPDGTTLFVGTFTGELDSDETDVTVLWSPRGVKALSTESGQVVQSWDIPAWEVYLSPTGEYLVATGITVEDRLSTSSESNEGTFIIDVSTGEFLAHLTTELFSWGGSMSVQFSRDGDLAYLTNYGGRIGVVELKTGEPVASITGAEYLTVVFGETGLLATRRHR